MDERGDAGVALIAWDAMRDVWALIRETTTAAVIGSAIVRFETAVGEAEHGAVFHAKRATSPAPSAAHPCSGKSSPRKTDMPRT